MNVTHLPILTVSEMTAFRACARYHHIKHGLGYRPLEDANPLGFGKAVHTGLEAWMSTKDLDAALAAIQPADGADFDAFALVKVEELLRGYHFRWLDSELQTVAVEAEFTTDLINPESGYPSKTFRLGGKIDAIASHNGLWVIEHKTTSEDVSQGSEYWLRLRLDAQVSTYFVGARSLGYDVRGCIYDVIRKSGIRPCQVALTDDDGIKIVHDTNGARVRTKDGKKWRQTGDAAEGYTLQSRPETPEEYRTRLRNDIADNPDKYYQRGEVVRLEDDELDAAADAWQVARQIADSARLGRHPRNPSSCVRWGRTCEFFAVCTRAASLDDETQFRRAAREHEELSPEIQEVA
jgi:hypothetical protein